MCCRSDIEVIIMARDVLVSYLERNKKLSIPEDEASSDIEFLRGEFITHFCFDKNVKLQITFQHYDADWEQYVDLEEDAVVCHKDKLKVIVIPRLSDSFASTANTSMVSTAAADCEHEVSESRCVGSC